MSLPKSFPEGTSFFNVDGIPVSRAPDEGFMAWDGPSTSGVGPPRPVSASLVDSEGKRVSEAEFRDLVAAKTA